MLEEINDIPSFETFSKIQIIDKGWSSDKKYYVETKTGEKRLLRISDISEYEKKKNEFDIMKRLSTVGINMSQPLDFGTCDNNKKVYQLLSWCEGEEAKELLSFLSDTEQYELGIEAGKILKILSNLEKSEPSSDWANFFKRKIDTDIERYINRGIRFKDDELLIEFLKDNVHLMKNRPTCLTHEDFRTDNLVISPDKKLFVIDFQQCGIVDPYYALMSVGVSAETSPQFAFGQLDEYFRGQIPEDFWQLVNYYLLAETFNIFLVALTLGQEEIDFANEFMPATIKSLDNLGNYVPDWFLSRNNKKLVSSKNDI